MVGEPEPEPSAALDVPPGCFSIGQRLVAEWRDPRDWRRIQTLCHETYEGPDGAQFQLDTNWNREEAEILYMVATQARQGARDAPKSHAAILQWASEDSFAEVLTKVKPLWTESSARRRFRQIFDSLQRSTPERTDIIFTDTKLVRVCLPYLLP